MLAAVINKIPIPQTTFSKFTIAANVYSTDLAIIWTYSLRRLGLWKSQHGPYQCQGLQLSIVQMNGLELGFFSI